MPPRNPSSAAARIGIAAFFLCATIFGGAGGPATAADGGTGAAVSDSWVKASWTVKCLSYIEWPAKAQPKSGEQITIGFLGDDPIFAELKRIVSGGPALTVRGRSVALRRLSGAGDVKGCQVLFIARSAKGDSKGVLSAVQGTGVLTISDMDRFTSIGGMIGFRSEGEMIRLEIDGAAAKREGMTISSNLRRAFK